MAIELKDKLNIVAPNGEYPFGDIRDRNGTNAGTKVNRLNHADFHQFFAKLGYESDIIFNGVPDNAYDGFQYWQMLLVAINRNGLANFATGAGTPTLAVHKGYNFYLDTTTGDIYYAFNSDFALKTTGSVPTAWVEVGSGGGAPAFQNSWANVSSQTPLRYRKNSSGVVTIDGVIQDGLSGTVIFTLPLAFRPLKQHSSCQFVSVVGSNNVALLIIQTNGDVQYSYLGGLAAVVASTSCDFYV